MTKLLMKTKHGQQWREKWVSLQEVAQWISTGKYRKWVEAARDRNAVFVDGNLMSGPVVEAHLPLIMPAIGVPTEPSGKTTPRSAVQAGYTGLVLLSFKVEQGVEVLERLRRRVNDNDMTLLSFIGASGRSLKVLMRYQLKDGTLPKEKRQVALFQQYAYNRAAKYALALTSMKVEEVAHDGTESFHLSYDPQVYYNPDALPIAMEQPTEPLTETTAPMVSMPAEVALDAEVIPGYTRREMDATKFNYICRNMAYDKQREHETYLMALATECRKAGIDKELAIKLTLFLEVFREKDVLVRSTFNNAYEKHTLGRANPVERAVMHQMLLEEFLRRRYMFRLNSVTGDLEYQEKDRYEMSWKPLTEEAQNDINNAAIHEGITVWPKDLDRILVSDYTSRYDPVREWLDALPQWDGRDRLGELADRVKTQTPGWRDNFKIWMRSMVSQWRSGRDAMYGAQMVLMFVGGQGTRKSTFMRMLLPSELSPFYIDRLDLTNKKESLRALGRFLLINIDEYDQISKTQTAFLKHLIQRTDVKERKMYSTTFEQQQRFAAFCATTNSLVPLKDESGSRRYLVIEVNGVIDTDTAAEKAIDYKQLYAQIVYEIEHGEEYAFTGERERLIIEQNTDYYETPNVISLFEDLFRKPQAGDQLQMLSPTEILTHIKEVRKLNIVNQANATLLGSYLHRNGYQKGTGERRRCYLVALKS